MMQPTASAISGVTKYHGLLPCFGCMLFQSMQLTSFSAQTSLNAPVGCLLLSYISSMYQYDFFKLASGKPLTQSTDDQSMPQFVCSPLRFFNVADLTSMFKHLASSSCANKSQWNFGSQSSGVCIVKATCPHLRILTPSKLSAGSFARVSIALRSACFLAYAQLSGSFIPMQIFYNAKNAGTASLQC